MQSFNHSKLVQAFFLSGLLAGIPVLANSASTLINSKPLRNALTVNGMLEHLQAIENIYIENGGRNFGTPGYNKTLDYIQQRLEATGYYNVVRQVFTAPVFTLNNPAILEQISPVQTAYVDLVDMRTANFSGSGDVTAQVVPIDVTVPSAGLPNTSPLLTSGCEASDFIGSGVSGKIALIQRGTCGFGQKATNALNAGAVGVILFNTGNTPANSVLLAPNLSAPVNLPVVGATFALGESIVTSIRNNQPVTMRLKTDTTITLVETAQQIVADTKIGDPSKKILLLSEADAAVDSPTMSFASGLAANLEIARQLPNVAPPRNVVRFIFGNAASNTAYRNSLSQAEYESIAAVMGLGNIGSSNFLRGVHDGDNSSGLDISTAPNGSGLIESVYLEYFNSLNLATAPGASSNVIGIQAWSIFRAPFRAVGGLATGNNSIKSDQFASIFGGTAGIAYHPPYETPTDTVANLNLGILDVMADAQAHAVYSLMTTKAAIVNNATLKPGKNNYVLPAEGTCGDDFNGCSQ